MCVEGEGERAKEEDGAGDCGKSLARDFWLNSISINSFSHPIELPGEAAEGDDNSFSSCKANPTLFDSLIRLEKNPSELTKANMEVIKVPDKPCEKLNDYQLKSRCKSFPEFAPFMANSEVGGVAGEVGVGSRPPRFDANIPSEASPLLSNTDTLFKSHGPIGALPEFFRESKVLPAPKGRSSADGDVQPIWETGHGEELRKIEHSLNHVNNHEEVKNPAKRSTGSLNRHERINKSGDFYQQFFNIQQAKPSLGPNLAPGHYLPQNNPNRTFYNGLNSFSHFDKYLDKDNFAKREEAPVYNGGFNLIPPFRVQAAYPADMSGNNVVQIPTGLPNFFNPNASGPLQLNGAIAPVHYAGPELKKKRRPPIDRRQRKPRQQPKPKKSTHPFPVFRIDNGSMPAKMQENNNAIHCDLPRQVQVPKPQSPVLKRTHSH